MSSEINNRKCAQHLLDCMEGIDLPNVRKTKYNDEKPVLILDDPFHLWFGLSYSSYLVLPRLMLESMPRRWQLKMIALLNQMDETLEIDKSYTSRYNIQYKDGGKFAKDPYRDYRHSPKLKLKDISK